MSTNIRSEVSKKSEYYIPKERYYELKHFCLQYPAWLVELNAFTRAYPHYPGENRIPKDNLTCADPTEREVERRERFVKNTELVDMTIKLTLLPEIINQDPLYSYLHLAVTRGYSYETLRLRYNIPCSREYYYKLYRKFFWLLDAARK